MVINMENRLSELEKRIGYQFKDRKLLKQAVTHSSYANEQKINKSSDYERLEFLGDAVLELVSSDFIFKENVNMSEGQMTKLRSSIVCEPALAYCARQIGLDQYILLGKGEESTGGRKRDSIISDVMEATIGALYLDGGMEQAKMYIHRFILSDLENKQLFYDAKTVLQEMVQQEGKSTIKYDLVKEEGPEHDKTFTVHVVINDQEAGEGVGHSKKAAEQQAAYNAILLKRREN